MLIWFVAIYLLISISIGLYAATRVHSAKDFAVAGRSLPLPVVMATVFVTWFGAETVLGISATFTKMDRFARFVPVIGCWEIAWKLPAYGTRRTR